ncbi:MAG: hypothetical protein ACE5K0_08695 [Candidatus Methanofastidiosia archaeon]
MKHWLGEPHPNVDIISPNMEFEKEAWKKELEKGVDFKALLKRFHSVRSKQIDVLNYSFTRETPETPISVM